MSADYHHYSFAGFTPEALGFLREVRERNSREWFEHHRHNLDELILDPLRALVSDLTGTMLSIDAELEVRPTVNKTISRIYRDTRFSRDKSLYRDKMWFTFKRRRKDWRDAPCYFFELSPISYRFGMGYYATSRTTMDALRQSIDADPAAFLKAASFGRIGVSPELHGEKYKRRLPNPHCDQLQDWYQRKTLFLAWNRKPDERLFSALLVSELAQLYTLVAPLYRYLQSLQRESN